MVKGGFGIKSKAVWVGWLVVFYTSSFPFDRECYYERNPRRERSTSVRYRLHKKGCDIHGRQNRTEFKKIRYGAMHKVMIGFVFPIGK